MTTALVIFAHSRPEKLRRVLAAVRGQTMRPRLIVGVVDGPRNSTEANLTRACARDMAGVCDAVVARPTNLGCAASIMGGVDAALADHDRVAVLEDDTAPAAHWYESISALLDYYDGSDLVAAVGGFPSVLNGSLEGRPDVVMSPRFSCWGWGTWRSRWSELSADWHHYRQHGVPPWNPAALPHHAGPDIPQMIANHQSGQLWDGIVAGSMLRRGWLQAVTRYYLVHNIGADAHCPQSKIDFMHTNNPIQERVPASFAVPVFDDGVAAAVRAYVAAMS